MQYKWYLPRGDRQERLVLYLNGWAMPPEVVEHLSLPEGYDLCVMWDYRHLSLPEGLQRYEEIVLVAWSMGVWAADELSAYLGELPIQAGIAICGTGYPMDDRWGIPEAIFRGTLEGLTEESRVRFNRRMCGKRSYPTLLEALASRATEEIREELACVLRHQEGIPHPLPKRASAPWTLALVGGQDRIIPEANQRSYWEGQGIQMRYLPEEAHYIFGSRSGWEELWG